MADIQEIEYGEQFSNMSLLLDANQESDSSSQDISDNVPPTLLALNNYRLPTEIISHMLSYIVPDGLQISDDPACEGDMTTIRTLLKTSIKVKHEMLHQIFQHPLRIHISNGKICGCMKIIHGKSTLLLKKISHLPLHKWTSVMISFAPTSQAESCVSRYIYRWQFEKFVDFLEPENQDPLGWNFIHAVDCVKRQSKQIGDALRFHCQPERRDWALSGSPYNRPSIAPLTFDCFDPRYRNIPKFNFIFHDPSGMVPEYKHREIPVWEMASVLSLLERWQWTSFQSPFQQAKFPLTMVLPCLDPGSQLQQAAWPHDPGMYVTQLEKDFTLWWQWKNSKARTSKAEKALNLAYGFIISRGYDIDWYLSKTPLIQHMTPPHIFGLAVLRLDASEVDPECDQVSFAHWKGIFIGTDG